MKRSRNPLGIIILGLGLFMPAMATVAETDRLVGTYRVEGKGSPSGPWRDGYSGTCEIQPQQQGHYPVSCLLADGTNYRGKGLLTGDVFSLYLGGYMNVYQIDADGRLQGRWIDGASDDSGTESLIPVR